VYLLDTDILSNLLKRAPSTALVARLAGVPVDDQLTSSITLGELLYGAYRLGSGGLALRERIELLLRAGRQILPFDAAAARHYGAARAELADAGALLGDADLRIAAIALSHNLTVVTGNVRHFERVPGLLVENAGGR
jgi:tRNA(fMet)-specific endonuclease VapC